MSPYFFRPHLNIFINQNDDIETDSDEILSMKLLIAAVPSLIQQKRRRKNK
jgi:hypothetical protein